MISIVVLVDPWFLVPLFNPQVFSFRIEFISCSLLSQVLFLLLGSVALYNIFKVLEGTTKKKIM